jgi:hypothetical protein
VRFSAWWIALTIFIAVILLVAPNALWLSRSSAIIHNTGTHPLTLRFTYFDQPERIIDIGTLPPGTSRFLWLDPIGEATLVIHVKDGTDWREHCANYIEQGMYRVEVTAHSPTEIECDTDLPLFDRLLMLDYLS